MLDRLELESFLPHLKERFMLEADGAPPLELVLVECSPLGQGEGRSRTPFSLVFRGPSRPVMPQRIYRLLNEGMGALELFLVPIGPDREGMRYEAVFT